MTQCATHGLVEVPYVGFGEKGTKNLEASHQTLGQWLRCVQILSHIGIDWPTKLRNGWHVLDILIICIGVFSTIVQCETDMQ